MVDCGLKISSAAKTILEEPITMDVLLYAIQKGKTKKAPRHDGICLEFFKRTWELTKQDMLTMMNNMYKDGIITDTRNTA
jgi:hypothetical protein